MLFDLSSSINEDSTNIHETESNIKNSPSLYLINDICNPKKDLNLKESENADENEDEKIYFLPKKNTHRYNNLSYIFRIQSAKKKRGPKKHKVSKKAEHTDWDKDNITSKIQIHYFNFIISFLNDCAKVPSFLGKKRKKFLNFNHKEKSKSSSKHLEEMKKLSILDILKNIIFLVNINILIKTIIK